MKQIRLTNCRDRSVSHVYDLSDVASICFQEVGTESNPEVRMTINWSSGMVERLWPEDWEMTFE